ncbi:kynureninase [Bacillus sp. FJAT-27225]|uniref:kynureninase n=1 Tax=Bacillus sp. FJAT-27225 TaxID=1743144 RepID=UPI00080C232B|nr:kynureninase [Bacillus sp. FJAT-27225]OCA84043.1 kynureninase [Bacillus sp. FJAT-27225]
MKADTFLPTIEYAQQLDRNSMTFREEFYIKEGTYYMDGNSLGLLSKRAEKTLLLSLDDWKNLGIDGWMSGHQPWFDFSEKLGAMTAPLIGAKPEETIVTGSITRNIHQILATFYKPEGKRTKIVAGELDFSSDIYAIKSQLQLHGLDPNEHLVLVKSHDSRTIDEADIISAMTDEVAIVWMPSVLYRSGQLLDMELLAKEAHSRNILIGFDLAHSIGALPHSMHDWCVDFAVWCNYKYLNSGPGGVGGLFVHERHHGRAPGLAGWFSSSKDKQFDLELELTHAQSAGAFQIGTPHILSAAPLLGSLEIFAEAGIENLRAKSLEMTDYMMQLIEVDLSNFGFTIGNPREDERRGGHVCLEHDEAARICKALKDHHVIPDFRFPNVIRLAPAALYTTFEDIWETIQILKSVMVNEEYKNYENAREVVA